MAMGQGGRMDGEGARTIVEPEEFLRSALEKIVFFECRVAQLEAELGAARTTAERARGDAASPAGARSSSSSPSRPSAASAATR